MTETGLIIAEVAFLVLLYLFVWAIIRASSRQLQSDQAPLPAPADDRPLIVPLDSDGRRAPDDGVEEAAEPPLVEPAPEPDWAALAPSGAAGPDPGPDAPDVQPPPPTEIGGAALAGAAVGALGTAGDPDESEFDIGEPLEASDAGDEESGRPERGSAFDLAADIHPRLVVEDSPSLPSGEEFDLTGGMTIGRSQSSDLALDDQFVSHMHARILRRGQYYFVVDLSSTNGTFLNDRRVERDAQLRVRDLLRMGDTVLRYEE